MKYKYNPPALIKRIFNHFMWHTSNEKILLTFDDGPNPGTTEIILNELDRYKIKALFFCVGNNIRNYPVLTKEIINSGHSIANHTFNHKIITKLSESEAVSEIEKFNEAYRNLFESEPQYFRPPHGKFNFKTGKLLKKYSLRNVMWSLLTYDYKNDLNIVKKSVSKYLEKDSIIVLHDSRKSKEIICDSIKIIVDNADKMNFEIGEPQECLK